MLPLDPRVRPRSLVDPRGSAVVEHRAAAKLLARGRSRLAQAGDERSVKHLTLLADVRLARAVREVREGVVVGTRASISLAVARFARPSVYAVAQEHQNLAFWADDLRRSFATTYPRLDAMVTLTPGDAAAYTSILPPEVLVRDIPNALPDRDVPSACSGAPVVVAAGRLTRQKGFDLLVAAFARVHRKHPDMAPTGSIFALSSRYEGWPDRGPGAPHPSGGRCPGAGAAVLGGGGRTALDVAAR
jgi:glycosyltransferase involved in cell wall biosynthesis